MSFYNLLTMLSGLWLCRVLGKRTDLIRGPAREACPLVGDFIAGNQFYYMATYYMYFLFLTYEVKCGAAALDIANQ